MIKIFKRHSVTILDRNWKVIKNKVKLRVIPRYGEYIYIEENEQYYKVLNIIHYLNNKRGVFIIVDRFGDKTPME